MVAGALRAHRIECNARPHIAVRTGRDSVMLAVPLGRAILATLREPEFIPTWTLFLEAGGFTHRGRVLRFRLLSYTFKVRDGRVVHLHSRLDHLSGPWSPAASSAFEDSIEKALMDLLRNLTA